MTTTTKHIRLAFAIIAPALLLVLYILYRQKKSDLLENGLPALMEDKTNKLYQLKYDSIYLNEATGNLYLKNLRVKGDTSLNIDWLKKGDTLAQQVLADVFIPLLEVQSFRTDKALLWKKLECERIILNDPQVKLYVFKGAKQDTARDNPQKFYKQILGNLNFIKADSLLISHANVSVVDFFAGKKIAEVQNATIRLRDVLIDSTGNADTTRTLFCKRIDIDAERILTGNGTKTTEILRSNFNTDERLVTIGQVNFREKKPGSSTESKLLDVSVNGINIDGPLEQLNVSIGLVKAKRANMLKAGTETGKKGKPFPIILSQDWISSFHLDSLVVDDLTYKSYPQKKGAAPSLIRNSLFTLTKLRLDRSIQSARAFVSKSPNIEVSNSNLSFTSKNGMYRFSLDGAHLISAQNKIFIKSFKITPLLGETAFAKKMKVQQDRYDITFNNIVANGVNMEKLLNGDIDVKDLSLKDNFINIVRNQLYPIDSTSKEKNTLNFPHQLLHQLKFSVDIARLRLLKTNIRYKEISPISQDAGILKLNNSTITFKGISNGKLLYGKECTFNLTSFLYDKIKLTTTGAFYLHDWKRGKFRVSGLMNEEHDARILSQITEPLSLMKIEKGNIKFLSFSIYADTAVANGTVHLLYDDFKISLLKKQGTDYDKKDILSLLANIAVKNANKSGEKERVPKVEYKRDKYRSFFNYVWKTVFTGIRRIII